ncbi:MULTISPECIES: hypothetical protein [Amycolatopsis]|uniref:Scramblase n=2 Tax=Amycolatopsis TaxID=1813 RepID=A0A1I4BU59_9PSEU|nr:hypothetical protein [Amycolatopsis sacchari]SFK72318.1 hypothetical protein SAMN05421835_13063 [Amycolatopsis sacchari]
MTSHSRRAGGGTLFTEPVLVVHQNATPAGSGVFDQEGRPLGAVVEVGRTVFRKVLRWFSGDGQYHVRDSGGSVVLKVLRHARTRFLVTRADGSPIGEILPESDGFTLAANGAPLGRLRAEPGQTRRFTISDATGAEVARGGLAADNYVVEVPGHLSDPLASLVVAAALTVDTALNT